MSHREMYINMLKQNNYKLTPQRLVILDKILNISGHINADTLFNKIDDKSIGIATIYRTLDLFTKIGILKKLRLDENSYEYDLSIGGDTHSHHHFKCIKCGKIIELYIDQLDELEGFIEKNHNLKITDHQLLLSGYCSDCKVE